MTGYIFGITIGTIILLSALGVVIWIYWKKRSVKKLIKKLGTSAEVAVNGDVRVWAKHTKNKFIDASLYRYNENMVFEVDSILVTDRALIVLEIKSIKGGIEGDASDPKWTKVLGENRFDITNPIKQNDKHIDHIVNMTNQRIPTISLIVFSDRARYINVRNTPPHVVVAKHADLFDTLDEINNSLPKVLNEDQVKEVHKNIIMYRTNKKQDIKFHESITKQGRGK